MKKIIEEYGDAIVGIVEGILWLGLTVGIFLGQSGILSKVLMYFQTNLLGI